MPRNEILGKKTIPVKLNRENTWGANDSGKCARTGGSAAKGLLVAPGMTMAPHP